MLNKKQAKENFKQTRLNLAEPNLGNLHQIARVFDMKIDVSLEAHC